MIAKSIERNSQTRGRRGRFTATTLAIVITIGLGMSGPIGVIARDASAASKGTPRSFIGRGGRDRSRARRTFTSGPTR